MSFLAVAKRGASTDQHGQVLDILVQSRRNTAVAKRRLHKLLKRQGWAPRVMITDKLASYAAAQRTIMPGAEHRQHKGLNNRAENSHGPLRHLGRLDLGKEPLDCGSQPRRLLRQLPRRPQNL